jgi:GDP-L-fucose synthase
MESGSRIYVAGHQGMVGSAICRRLLAEGCRDIVTAPFPDLDLRDFAACREFFERERPEYVFLAAARVGGILANSRYPAEFILDNLKIQTNVIELAWRSGVQKLLFLGSSCIYPRMADQPIREESLLTGPLEPTNEPYAVAKIAGIELCQALHRQYGFEAISIMPTNLYGPGDNFDLENAHVIPALLHRFHRAREANDPAVTVWGTGTPRREFLHVDDLAGAAVHLMRTYRRPEIVNVGVGDDVSIAELAATVREVVGYPGEVVFDPTRPDGTPRKLLDVSRLAASGWTARIGLMEGLRSTWEWFRRNITSVRR